MKWKTIVDCIGALGGYEYRVTSNGETANIQSRCNSTWHTEATMPLVEFERRHEERGNKLSPDYMKAIAREFNAK